MHIHVVARCRGDVRHESHVYWCIHQQHMRHSCIHVKIHAFRCFFKMSSICLEMLNWFVLGWKGIMSLHISWVHVKPPVYTAGAYIIHYLTCLRVFWANHNCDYRGYPVLYKLQQGVEGWAEKGSWYSPIRQMIASNAPLSATWFAQDSSQAGALVTTSEPLPRTIPQTDKGTNTIIIYILHMQI